MNRSLRVLRRGLNIAFAVWFLGALWILLKTLVWTLPRTLYLSVRLGLEKHQMAQHKRRLMDALRRADTERGRWMASPRELERAVQWYDARRAHLRSW